MLFTSSQLLLGQQSSINYGYPLIHNYTSKEYIVAENVNWAATQDELGNMYFANNHGILKFDGNYWTLISTNTQAISICYDSISKTVFVGCVEDFGFIKVSNNGKLSFVSLTNKLNKNEKIGMVWDCFSSPQGIFFKTENKLLRYKEGKFKTWEAKNNFHKSFYAGDKIFVRDVGTGLFCIEDNVMVYINGSEVFADQRVDFIEKSNKAENEYILASREKGLIRFQLINENGQYSIKLIPINNGTEKLFGSNIIYNGIKLSNNNLAFSTEAGGLLMIDMDGNLVTQYNIDNGLNCNLINDVFEDKNGNLWLSTENGISLVMHSLPNYNFQNKGNISGMTESIAKLGDVIYIGTSTGLFQFNKNKNQFEKFDFPFTQVWQLTAVNDKKSLIASTTKGIYRITSAGYNLLTSTIENVYTVCESQKHKNIYYVGHLNGFAAFKNENGKFNLIYNNPNINYSIRSITEDESGNIWLSTQYDGLIYVNTSQLNAYKKVNDLNSIKFTLENGLPNLNDNFVYIINKEVVVATYNGVYKLNNGKPLSTYSTAELGKLKFIKSKSFEPYNSEQDIQTKKLKVGVNTSIWMLSYFPNGKYDFGSLTKNNNGFQWINTPFKIIAKDKINEFFIDSNLIWFGGSDLISCFDNSKKYPYNFKYCTNLKYVITASDTIFHGNYYKTYKTKQGDYNQLSNEQPEELKKSFSYQNNDFTFQFGATSFIADNPSKFSCFLEGEDEKWSEWNSETFKTYMNLYEGKYIFKVKAKNIFGTESTIATYEFSILPPWYRTKVAYFIYFILALGFVYGVVVIFTRNLNRIIKKQTAELYRQKDEIVRKNKEITDSIYYAKRIQDAIMPSNEYIKNMFTDSFILFKPKDIVSGDFYWANLRENNAILAAVDCTGHGVPGAFMSMMGNDYLNDIIVESKINEPHDILNKMRSAIIKALKQRGESGESKDGMDMALVNINKDTLILSFAGANNPLYIVRKSDKPAIANSIEFSYQNNKSILYEIKGNKFPVGIHMGTTLQPFIKQDIQLFKGDMVYMFSDGYADQFGGPVSKKLKYNQFKKFILESMFLTMEEQKIYLEQKLNEWQGDIEQVDDVLVMGVRIV
jgi:serine phosphatase RsbU (regulator of sigma subunit)/ligand-binding sensor domain-containing protein